MIPSFEVSNFPHDHRSYPLYTKGHGPGVIVIHELPGLTTECIALANRIVEAGYRVYMPLLFGRPGEKAVKRNLMRVCISKEFRVFAMNKSSPIVAWLKGVCAHALHECGGTGVGVIGMCLTGNFAISLMADPTVLAPISCQPSLPFPISKKRTEALAMSPEELRAATQRAKQGQSLMCFRFTCDKTSPEARFNKLADTFGSAFKGRQIDSSPSNRHGIPTNAHAVLTGDFVDKTGHPTREALDQVLAFFEDRLRT